MEKKENQRITLTKRLLQEALLLMLRDESINKISVRDLCEKAGINRTTFYNHYSCPADVLNDISQSFMNDIGRMLDEAESTNLQSVAEKMASIFRYMEDHHELARLLLSTDNYCMFADKLFTHPAITSLSVEKGVDEISATGGHRFLSHGLSLRRSKKCSPLLFPEVPLSLAIAGFLTFFTVRIFLQNTPVFPQCC